MRAVLLIAFALLACGQPRRNPRSVNRPPPNGPTDSGNPVDSGSSDSGAADSSTPSDSGTTDSGTFDSGFPDTGVPACPVTEPETNTSVCLDACDNDGNGFADCNDFNCCPYRSNCPLGTTCGDAPPMCVEVKDENTIQRCTNGCDDDPTPGDPPFADCEDRACCLVRQAGGQPCSTGTYCADQFVPRTALCPGDDVFQEAQREATLGACSNACDDDRNGFDDCSDRHCCAIRIAGDLPCPSGTYCADMWTPMAVLCSNDDVTQPPGTEADAVTCSDSCDNDRNGFQDCDDRDCCPFRVDCPLGSFCNP